MSSFLKDILTSSSGEKDGTGLSGDISILKREIVHLKSNIHGIIKEKYADLELDSKPDETLAATSEQLVLDMKSLQNQIDDQVKVKLITSTEELNNLSLQLKEFNYSLQISSHLLEIHKSFEALKNLRESEAKHYRDTALILVKLNSLVMEDNSDISMLLIYEAIKEEYQKNHHQFVEELIKIWKDRIIFANGKDTSKRKFAHLRISLDQSELLELVSALNHMKKLSRLVESLSKNLLEHFVNPIIHYDCAVQETNELFSIEVANTKQTPSHEVVLHNLHSLFAFLSRHFNVLLKNDYYLIQKLSELLLPEFSDILSKDCISKIIPSSTSEMKTFESTIAEIEEFQNFLIKINFISEEQKFLSPYTNNIDQLYIDKKCERYFEMARSIMKKDLHDSFKFKPEDSKQLIHGEDTVAEYIIDVDKKLDKHMFTLPECQISKSAQEVLLLIEDIMNEAPENLDSYASRFFYVSRNIIEMYAALVPEIHKSFLATIPQQVALFHNNCMYLAHNLAFLTTKYRRKMSSTTTSCVTFVDQIMILRQVGTEHFLSHMKYQRDMIFGILRESGLSLIGQMPALPATTERALRQCIRQLELLKTVWIEILPIRVYCRVLGCIVNDMTDDLCSKVISVEDIPADVASELVTLFTMVVKRIPQIFPDPILIEQHVSRWRKLKELIVILGASLKEIEDRWADGKGPLAGEFSAKQVKQLIRALFQNTERRSNLLSKIRDR
ncbi:hypothetical protein QAD02_000235 [Eretmocerus hayati]|uniref:Uncharacterized protein n=1 Tax=Eretmocerus hayati TaxID=131215 RepID=A0ACC2ND10_9HYME|nr:hypothetical protein QAD02_000235 [Eretmocerus hayati]